MLKRGYYQLFLLLPIKFLRQVKISTHFIHRVYGDKNVSLRDSAVEK